MGRASSALGGFGGLIIVAGGAYLKWGKDSPINQSLVNANSQGASAASAAASASANASDASGTEAAWVRSRMTSVESKLSGGNSAYVTILEAKLSTVRVVASAAVQEKLREVVLGPADSLRRALPAAGLTVEQQVDVLVEQATDPNILARTYFGWKPWL